jgi:hypothetical protein
MTDQRQLAHRLAKTEPDQALAVARKINDPWFRCQALSHVARYWPGSDYDQLLKEALKAADSHEDVYRQVTVAAWPIRAHLERGSPVSASIILGECVERAPSIGNMGSRSEALFMCFQAIKPAAADLWKRAFWALIEATEPALAWRQRRNIRDAIAMVAADDPQLVQAALNKLSDEKTISAIIRDIENKRRAQPRPFFWA